LPKLSTVIETRELSPSLAFGAAYFSVSSVGTRLSDIQEVYTKDGFTGNATFFVRIPDSDSRLQVTLRVDSSAPRINLEIADGDKSKLRTYLDEIAQRIKGALTRFSNAPGIKLAQASKAVLVERKLDEALCQLLTEPDYQRVYVLVADARERLIRLGGVFEPATLQMSATLTPLAGQTGVIPQNVHEELALDILRWKKRIKQVVESLLSETDEE
jgi:hypothetical protein